MIKNKNYFAQLIKLFQKEEEEEEIEEKELLETEEAVAGERKTAETSIEAEISGQGTSNSVTHKVNFTKVDENPRNRTENQEEMQTQPSVAVQKQDKSKSKLIMSEDFAIGYFNFIIYLFLFM